MVTCTECWARTHGGPVGSCRKRLSKHSQFERRAGAKVRHMVGQVVLEEVEAGLSCAMDRSIGWRGFDLSLQRSQAGHYGSSVPPSWYMAMTWEAGMPSLKNLN